MARVAVTPVRRKLRRELYFEGRESVGIKAPKTWDEFGCKSRAGILKRVREKGKRRERCREALSCIRRIESLTRLRGFLEIPFEAKPDGGEYAEDQRMDQFGPA